MSGGNQEEINSRKKNTTKNTIQAPSSSRPGTAPVESQRGGRGSGEDMGCGSSINKQPGTFADVADSGRGQDNRAPVATSTGNNSFSESEDNDKGNGNINAQGEASRTLQHRGDHGDGASAMENGETPTSHADLPKELSSKLKELETKKEVYYREEVYLAMKAEYLQYINKLQTQVTDQQDYKSKFKSEQKKVTSLEKKVGDLSEKVPELQRKLEHAEEMYRTEHERAQALDKEVKDFADRLSSEMSEKMARDESSLENVSIKNRPMNVSDEYQALCSNQWLDAKQYLDTKYPKDGSEIKKIEILTKILMISHSKCEELEKEIMREMERKLAEPFGGEVSLSSNRSQEGTPKSQRKVSDKPRLEKSVGNTLTAIGDNFRITADEVELSAVLKIVLDEMEAIYDGDTITIKALNKRKIITYIKACVRLAWKMVNQRPPMMLNARGTNDSFDPKTQDVNYGSAGPEAKDVVVACYVQPALYHDKKLMCKGKVILMKQKDK